MEEDGSSASLDMQAVKRRMEKDGDNVADEDDDEIDSEVYGIEDEEDEESGDIR
jgi:hypothetical protein